MKFINMTMHGWKGCFDYQRCSCASVDCCMNNRRVVI